jgi:hypothetical protein
MVKPSDFIRVNSDINGNSRFVCHYLNLNSDVEASVIMGWNSKGQLINDKYAQALERVENTIINNMVVVLFSNVLRVCCLICASV